MSDHPPVDRLTSGVPGLDTILHGGFIPGGIYLIQGLAGSGKTILGNQLCCHRVRNGGRALFVTLLAEAVDRMLLNIGGMSFFNPQALPQNLHYVSGLQAFEAEGFKGLLELLRREVRTRRADTLVIDGLGSAEEPVSASASIGEFTHHLQAQNSLLGCTTFMLSRGTHAAHAERTVVDGLVELSAPLFGVRRERRLELHLFRGSAHLVGEHSYRITDDGLRVYPRLEAVLAESASSTSPRKREIARAVTSGIPDLDAMLGDEGLPDGSALLVSGAPSSGKSALAMRFLSPCTSTQRGAYLSFSQDLPRLPHSAAIDSSAVQWLYRPARERLIDALGQELLDITKSGEVQRLVIDGLDGFEQCSAERERVAPFLGALLDELRTRGVTTLCTSSITSDFSTEGALPGAMNSSLFDVHLELQFSSRATAMQRSLALLKSPARPQPALAELTLDAHGVHLGPWTGSATAEPSVAAINGKPLSSKPPPRPRNLRRKVSP